MTFTTMQSISYLKQARKNSNLSLQDMAYLLEMDVSNLSKYERGIKIPSLRVILGYHSITKTPLPKLGKRHVVGIVDGVSNSVTHLIAELEEEMTSPKMKKRIEALYEAFNNISCLKDVSEQKDED